MRANTKIVLLTDCMAYLTAGAERQIFELAGRLTKRNFEVIIASLECGGAAPRELITAAGCRLEVFPVRRIYGLSGLLEGWRFLKFLKNEKPSFLMTYHFSSDIWGPAWARLAGVEKIVSNRRDMGFWRGRPHILAYRAVNLFVDTIVVNSVAIKKKIITEEKLPADKVRVIYNGVDLKTSSSGSAGTFKKELGLTGGEIVIMHVANLRPVKGHRFLLEALARIKPEFHNFKLVIIGEGELRPELERQACQLDLENNILFLGKREDARELLACADICVLPSLSEGLSNAILEYMAAGKPVIATDTGGNTELVQTDFNGILVEKGDSAQLAAALLKLLRDDGKRRRFGENSLKKAAEFSMEKMIGEYEKLLVSKV